MALSQRVQKLGQALVRKKVLDDMQLASALASAEQWGQRLTQAILHLRLARETTIVDALAELGQVPKVDFRERTPEPNALAALDADFCRKHGVMPFLLTDEGRLLHLAMADPSDLAVIDEIGAKRRLKVKVYVAGEHLIDKAIQRFYLGMNHISLEAAPEEAPVAELDEIKLVDAAGKTLMLQMPVATLNALREAGASANKGAAAAPPPPPPPPAPKVAAPVAFTPPPKPPAAPAPDPLAGLLDAPPTPNANALGPRVQELEKQLAALTQRLTHSERILRCMLDILLANGTVNAEDLRARLNQYGKVNG